jgi:hypothetical protein
MKATQKQAEPQGFACFSVRKNSFMLVRDA